MTQEIVVATTSSKHAEQMQRALVGHTMSGEALEQRPQVQLASGADFLDAALRVYDIINIRLVPSEQYPSLIEVIAEYKRHIFRCEACGNECNYPGQLFVMHFSEHHCWCSLPCRKKVEDLLAQEVQAGRAELGDAVETALNYLLQNNTLILPMKLHRLLTERELREASNRLWAIGRQGLLTALLERIAVAGITDLASMPRQEKTPAEQPRWVRGEHPHEYWQGELRLGYVVSAQEATVSWSVGDYHSVIDQLGGRSRTLYIGSSRPLKAAKQRVEEFCRQEQAAAATHQYYLNYRFLAFRLGDT